MCKWEVDSRLVSRKLVCPMILAVESGIHELGTGRQAVSQSVSVHCAGRHCPRPWATTLDGGHGVMGAICFISCSRDGLLYCFNLSDVYYLLTCDLLSFNGGKKALLKKQNSEVRTSAACGSLNFQRTTGSLTTAVTDPPVPWQTEVSEQG